MRHVIILALAVLATGCYEEPSSGKVANKLHFDPGVEQVTVNGEAAQVYRQELYILVLRTPVKDDDIISSHAVAKEVFDLVQIGDQVTLPRRTLIPNEEKGP